MIGQEFYAHHSRLSLHALYVSFLPCMFPLTVQQQAGHLIGLSIVHRYNLVCLLYALVTSVQITVCILLSVCRGRIQLLETLC